MTDQQKAEIITGVVYDYFGIEKNDKSRKREIVEARHFSMYYIRRYTRLSLVNIGVCFKKDHASVLHAIRTAADLITWNGYRGKNEAIICKIEHQLNCTDLEWCNKVAQY